MGVIFFCESEMVLLIKLPVISKVLFEGTTEPVPVTHNNMYYGTATCLIKYRLDIHYPAHF